MSVCMLKRSNSSPLLYSISSVILNGSMLNATDSDNEEIIEVLKPQPNTALLSFILMMGTFIIAFKLKHFRNSKYLGRSVSNKIHL